MPLVRVQGFVYPACGMWAFYIRLKWADNTHFDFSPKYGFPSQSFAVESCNKDIASTLDWVNHILMKEESLRGAELAESDEPMIDQQNTAGKQTYH